MALNTYEYEIAFECANTGELKVVNKIYTTNNKSDANAGIRDYCANNKTMIAPIARRIK